MNRHGLLLTITECPPAMEDEFNAWYDDEHMAERLSIPGFLSARRWVADCKPGEGKYLATYELASPEILDSAPYLARFNNQTPWSRRCLGKAVVFRRWAMEQLRPGAADSHPAAKAVMLVCGNASTEGLVVPGALQARHFLASSGTPAHVALFDLAWPGTQNMPALDDSWLVRIYRAYV
jgi:hypothetical protein